MSLHTIDRRTLLKVGGLGLAGIGLPSARASTREAVASSVILIWLSGGSSHIDMWDMKPQAPAEYRGEFRPVATSAPGVEICEHLPLTAKVAHHLAIVRSLGHYGRGTGDHHAGYYYNLTGHAPDPSFRALLNDRKPLPTDWPFLGSLITSRLPTHPYLPSLITLPQKPGAPQYTRPGQFAARLGVEFDPVYVLGNPDKPLEFAAPALSLEGNVSAERLTSRRALLDEVDEAIRAFEGSPLSSQYTGQQARAFSLLTSERSKRAFDLASEPQAVRDRYGPTVNGMAFLLARRLVEASVPFVSVFWQEDMKLDKKCKSAGGWDTHGSNFACLKDDLLPEFDRIYSALIEDLHARGLLSRTLVLVTSEMGRQPRVGDPRSGGVQGAGRDHWTHCMSAVLAGGGVRGGQVYGSSDKLAAYPAEDPVAPEDIARTACAAMGTRPGEAIDREGRPFPLLPEGRILGSLF
jgi:hypothetical protein